MSNLNHTTLTLLEPNYINEGEYKIHRPITAKSIKLYRAGWPDKDKIDITNNLFKIEIYEDLFSIIKATLIISDIINMLENLPIAGGERIDFRFDADTSPNYPLMQTMVVYQVSRRYYDNDNNKIFSYVLELCSIDRYHDINKSVLNSFKGNYTDIIENILKNHLQTDKQYYTKEISLKPLNKDVTFISPGWTPLQCCSNIALRALSENNGNPMLFFETLDGFYFISFKKLYDFGKEHPLCRLYLESARTNASIEFPAKAFRRVIEFEYDSSNEKMENMIQGVFGADLFTFDTRNNNLEKTRYDYYDLFYGREFPKLENYPAIITSDHTKRERMLVQYATNDDAHKAFFLRRVFLGILDLYRIKVIVPGDPNYGVGKIVKMKIPSKEIGESHEEYLSSGNWLITSLKHTIDKEHYYTMLELCKDSLNYAPTNIPEYPDRPTRSV